MKWLGCFPRMQTGDDEVMEIAMLPPILPCLLPSVMSSARRAGNVSRFRGGSPKGDRHRPGRHPYATSKGFYLRPPCNLLNNVFFRFTLSHSGRRKLIGPLSDTRLVKVYIFVLVAFGETRLANFSHARHLTRKWVT